MSMFRNIRVRHSPRGLRALVSLTHDVLLSGMRLKETRHIHSMYRSRDRLDHSKGLDTPSRVDKPTLVWARTHMSSSFVILK